MGGRGSTGLRSTIQKALDSMEITSKSSASIITVKNLLPVASDEIQESVGKTIYFGRRDPNKKEVYVEKEIPISSILTEQDDVYKNVLSGIALNPYEKTIEGVNPSYFQKSYGDMGIIVVKYNDKYVLTDGNHRVNAAILRKQKTIKVRELKFVKR